jgi:hypothetical protein
MTVSLDPAKGIGRRKDIDGIDSIGAVRTDHARREKARIVCGRNPRDKNGALLLYCI